MTRYYLPLTGAEVEALAADRRLVGPRPAHAVTADLQEAWPDGDQEGWEYAALMAAADESWTRRSADDPARRWVLAVEIQDGEAAPRASSPDQPTRIQLPDEVVWRSVAALHVDGDEVAGGLPGEDLDLAWFARQEIGSLVSQAWTRSHSHRLPPTSQT